MIHVDFETRSRLSIRTVGRDNYVRHTSTSILCMAWAYDDGPVHLWLPGDPVPDWPEDATFMAHNAEFEHDVFTYIGWQHGLPAIPFVRWRCSAAHAAHFNIPRDLDHATRFLLPEEFWKDKAGEGLIKQLCEPDKNGRFNNDPVLLQQLFSYCKQDVIAERALSKALPPLSDTEQAYWVANCIVNERGVPADLGYIRGALKIVSAVGSDLGGELERLTDYEVRTPKQIKKMLHWLNTRGVNVDSLSASSVRDVLEDKTIPEECRKVLEIRQVGASASIGKLPTICNLASTDDHRVRGAFWYYGASATGRVSSVGVQFQNLSALIDGTYPLSLRQAIEYGDPDLLRMLHPAPMALIGETVRWGLAAPDGKLFVMSDLAQIECRVLAWLAGHRDMLDAFASGRDLYKELACKVFNVKLEHVSKDQRQMAKVTILSAGYGAGAKRMQAFLAQMGITVSLAFAQSLVDAYRSEHHFIPTLWRNVENAVKKCVTTRRPIGGKLLRFEMVDDRLEITLPSSRKLYYHQPSITGEGRDQWFKYLSPRYGIRHEWAGGIVTENVTQAIARDIMMHGMMLAEHAGLTTIGSIHDELICEEPEEFAEERMVILERCMSVVPPWTPGLPLSAEGRVRKYLTK